MSCYAVVNMANMLCSFISRDFFLLGFTKNLIESQDIRYVGRL